MAFVPRGFSFLVLLPSDKLHFTGGNRAGCLIRDSASPVSDTEYRCGLLAWRPHPPHCLLRHPPPGASSHRCPSCCAAPVESPLGTPRPAASITHPPHLLAGLAPSVTCAVQGGLCRAGRSLQGAEGFVVNDLISKDVEGWAPEEKVKVRQARCLDFPSDVSASLWSSLNLISPSVLPVGKRHSLLNNHCEYLL